MNMPARDRALSRSLPIITLALIASLAPAPATRGAETVIIGDLTFVNKALVGVGRLPSDLRDKFGETLGSGSAMGVDPKSWVRTPGAAIRPPEAFVPKRKGKDHFASNNPGPGAQAPEPPDPETGRANNQGFEGLTVTPPGGKFLVVALQSATRQDGGSSPETRRYSRLLYYDITDRERPKLAREHVVPLPLYQTADRERRVAAQSELLALDETFFLLLCRDSGNGYGAGGATSRYRS